MNPGRGWNQIVRLSVMLSGIALAAAGQAPPRDPAIAAGITRQLVAAASAWNAGDIVGHVAMYADTAEFMTGRGPLRGRDRIRATLERGFWRDGKPVQHLRFEEIRVRPVGRDAAIVTGRFVLHGGGMKEAAGRFSLTWARTEDGWRVMHDHSS